MHSLIRNFSEPSGYVTTSKQLYRRVYQVLLMTEQLSKSLIGLLTLFLPTSSASASKGDNPTATQYQGRLHIMFGKDYVDHIVAKAAFKHCMNCKAHR